MVPNGLLERIGIPDQRKGVISISDITADIAEAGTTGYIIVNNLYSKDWLQFLESLSYIKFLKNF